MKKLIAGLAAIMILVCGCTAAFAEQKILTKEEAIQVALDRVGMNEKDVTFTNIEMDWDDGRQVWEIEFLNAGYEYEFDIDARIGCILEMDVSRHHGSDRVDWDDIFDFD